MFRFEDSFEDKVKDADDVKASEHLNASIAMAQKCLTNGDFHKYREEFQKAYDLILVDMMVFTERFMANENANLEMYAIKMVRYMQRVQDLRVLLNKVSIDANKEKVEVTNG